jgi:nucleoside-diphosphate-sugar epimerase
MEKCRIIIPGGAGFVGRNLVRVLHSENYDMNEVTVLDKDKSNLAFVKSYQNLNGKVYSGPGGISSCG